MTSETCSLSVESEPRDKISERRYPVRGRRPPDTYRDNFYFNSDFEPETYKEVMNHPQDKWLEAMDTEYNSLIKNGIWILVDRPTNRKTTKCK